MYSLDTKILVVDDMSTMRKIVMKSCMGLGFKNIVEASDGAQGWEIVSAIDSHIQFVISDWNMPNCTGLDLLKRVRSDGRFKNLPFILLTAESETSQVTEALLAGVDGYIVKPFSADTLRAKFEEIYKKKAA